MWDRDVLLAALGLSQLDLNAVDAVHAVDEEDQYEDESDLWCCQPLQARKGTSAELPSCHTAALL